MPVPNPEFRPSSSRAINFFGPVGDLLVDKLAPEILRLRENSDDVPITVYINSDGGDPRCTDFVYSLITNRTPGGKRPRVITVAVGNAASAAAVMLALGDYAIAYPKADIHFHGLRYNTKAGTTITKEIADLMAEQLQTKNLATASVLARKGTERMAFHYARLKNDCQDIAAVNPKISQMECFSHLLKQKLSHNGQMLVVKAEAKWREIRKLIKAIHKLRSSGRNGIEFEAAVLKRVISYEIARHKKDDEWDLDAEGIVDVVSDYLTLREYDVGKHVGLVMMILNRFPLAFFSEDEFKQLGNLAGNLTSKAIKEQATTDLGKMVLDKLENYVKPLCYFTSSIWRAMHEEENPLTPVDAYWLGAIDEVYGTRLPCLRVIAEADKPEQPNLPLATSTEPEPPSAQSQPAFPQTDSPPAPAHP